MKTIAMVKPHVCTLENSSKQYCCDEILLLSQVIFPYTTQFY